MVVCNIQGKVTITGCLMLRGKLCFIGTEKKAEENPVKTDINVMSFISGSSRRGTFCFTRCNIKELYIFPTEYFHVYHKILTTDSDYLFNDPDLSNVERMCFL
jgi:hypothetical protein